MNKSFCIFLDKLCQLNNLKLIKKIIERNQDNKYVKRIRGTAIISKCSTPFLSKMVDSARGVLNSFLPDVWISTELCKNGKSLYYGLSLHSNTFQGGASAFDSEPNPSLFSPKIKLTNTNNIEENQNKNDPPSPETIGRMAALQLLDEIHNSSSRVSTTQLPLVLTMMALSDSEQLSSIVIGRVSAFAVNLLRLVKLFFGVEFQFKELDIRKSINQMAENDSNFDRPSLIVAKCLGCGLRNRNKHFF